MTEWPRQTVQTLGLLFRSAAYIQVYFRPDFIMEANTMSPDQTSPLLHIVCNISYLRT